MSPLVIPRATQLVQRKVLPPLHALRQLLPSGSIPPLRNVRHLLFPNVCLVCEQLLQPHEEHVCGACYASFDAFASPELAEYYVRRTITDHFCFPTFFERAWSRYKFHKESDLQELLHSLKYQGIFTLGVTLGKQLGEWLHSADLPDDIECIVPIPLHPLKKIERSYNQAEKIAEGISQLLNRPVRSSLLTRQRYMVSQTGLSATERQQNAEGAFGAKAPLRIGHVLLVDDVLTTGATMVAAAQALHDAGVAKVSIATVAVAAKEM